MGVGVTEGRDPAIEATGVTGRSVRQPEDSGAEFIAYRHESPRHIVSDEGRVIGYMLNETGEFAICESPRDALSLRVTEDRVLIKADREDHAPTQTEAGIYLASSLAAAVDGADEAESWFVGTIVQVGPLVHRFEARPAMLRWLWDAETEGIGLSPREVRELITRVQELPMETPEPVRVGDRVCFSWAAGQQITVDGERFLILRVSDVLAVLEE